VRIIYEPRGRAGEYGKLAANGFNKCNHGCHYCFNQGLAHCSYEDFLKPSVRKGVLEGFRKDCRELAAAGDQREILLSFTTDPYNELEDQYRITREMIGVLIENGLHYTVLTKAGRKSTVDFDLMATRPDLCRYGTTLTFYDPADRRLWEPNAASTMERLVALMGAKKRGIPTWVSMEPVIYPKQTIDLIVATLDLVHKRPGFVDEYRIGGFNHIGQGHLQEFIESIGYQYPPEAEWIEFARKAKTLLDKHGCRYIFKKDLQPYLQATGVTC